MVYGSMFRGFETETLATTRADKTDRLATIPAKWLAGVVAAKLGLCLEAVAQIHKGIS